MNKERISEARRYKGGGIHRKVSPVDGRTASKWDTRVLATREDKRSIG